MPRILLAPTLSMDMLDFVIGIVLLGDRVCRAESDFYLENSKV